MKTAQNRRYLVLRTALAAVAALALLVAGMGNAFADPARSSSASAFGLRGTGLVAVPETPRASATQPPDAEEKRTTVPLNAAGALVINATLTAEAIAHRESDIDPHLPLGANPKPMRADNNSRGFARTEGLSVLATGTNLADPALVRVGLIEAEAVARCENNRPVFDANSRMTDITVGGINLSPTVEGLLAPVLNLLDPAGGGGLLSALVSVRKNEIINLPDGIAVNALRISILPGTAATGPTGPALQELVVSHAEAHMPTPCGIDAPPPSPGPKLAQTGGGGLSSMVGASLLAGAVLMIVFVRKYRLSN